MLEETVNQNKDKPVVSIVICTYNRSGKLEETLQSVVKQDFASLEIIVVDNNSTDDTVQVVKKYPVKYVLEKRQGVAYARNTGLETSRGDYLAFIDDDETVNPDWVTEILKGFKLDPKVAVVTGPVVPVYEIAPPRWLPDSFHGSTYGEEFFVFQKREAIGTGNSIFRKETIADLRFTTDLGRKKNNLLSGEDTDFVDRLYRADYYGAYSPRACVYHWIPKGRISLRWSMRRYFYEGLTEYMRKGNKVFWSRLLKPIPNVVGLLISILSLRPLKVVRSWLRLCQTMGILYGPLYKMLAGQQ